MQQGEEAKVCALVEEVFNEFVAPGYGEDGIKEFFKFANPLAMAERAGPAQVVVVAEQGSDLVGMIEIRNGAHIALLFVRTRGQGIAKELVRRAVAECRQRQPELHSITVNSSPYAEPMYAQIGFQPTDAIQEKNGIKFVPMILNLQA